MPGAEFAHYEEGKEVVPSQDRGKYIVVARSSLESPEAVPCDPGSNTRYLRHTAEDTVSPIKKRRKLCWILPVSSLAILIVLAAVLGGIFGSRASKGKPSSSSPVTNGTNSNPAGSDLPRPIDFTSLAAAINPSTSELLLYYQAQNTSIVEVSLQASVLSGTDLTANHSIVLVMADAQTALAATTWKDPATKLARSLLTFSKNGYVAVTNRTETQPWAASWVVSNSTFALHSRALTVCADPGSHMSGLRIYFGSAEGFVREIIYYGGSDSWWTWWAFQDSDPSGGVTCTLQIESDYTYLNVYMRNKTTSQLTQSWWLYPDDDFAGRAYWPEKSSPYPMSSNSNITAVSDGMGVDTVIVSSPNGTVTRSSAVPHGQQWLQLETTLQTGLVPAGAVTAWYIDGTGPVWVYQDAENKIRGVSLDGKINATIV